jgi:hypothetical protein
MSVGRLRRGIAAVVFFVTFGSVTPAIGASGDHPTVDHPPKKHIARLVPAAVGDQLADIAIPVQHDPGGCCTIALDFDGTRLWYANLYDAKLYAMNTDGVLVKALDVGTEVSALSYDRKRKLMYVCQNGAIGSVDVTAADGSTVTPKPLFSSSCFDGMAYDGSDDTFYTSPDANGTVTQYRHDGTEIRSVTVPFPNSGIVVGAKGYLYMGSDGDGVIYRVAKSDLESVSQFASPGGRDEDLACDNNSFPGKTALWSTDAYNNHVVAFEVESGTCSYAGIVPSRTKSSLSLTSSSLRFVPADGQASAHFKATVLDPSGKPMSGRKVTLVATGLAGPARAAAAQATVDCPKKTDAHGVAYCSVSGRSPGHVTMQLSDTASGLELGSSRVVEFTRKVVVLVMGFNSWLQKRFCYWGYGTDGGKVPKDGNCENYPGTGHDPTTDQGTVYGYLIQALGFKANWSLVRPGATILEMSWADGCDLVTGKGDCIASVSNAEHDAVWTPPDYSIGGIPDVVRSPERQALIDSYAKWLVSALERYDRALSDPENGAATHASFYLVGHSMGGELVVRALRKALANHYFTDPGPDGKTRPTRRGLLQTVISVDGAINWWNLGPVPQTGAFTNTFALPKAERTSHCGSPYYTLPSEKKEKQNAAAVEDASVELGTTTVAITNGLDWVIPDDTRLAKIPNGLISTPVRPKTGYVQRVYWGWGAGTLGGWPSGDPDCGHSTLLRSQAKGLWSAQSYTNADRVHFPLANLLRDYIGKATP